MRLPISIKEEVSIPPEFQGHYKCLSTDGILLYEVLASKFAWAEVHGEPTKILLCLFRIEEQNEARDIYYANGGFRVHDGIGGREFVDWTTIYFPSYGEWTNNPDQPWRDHDDEWKHLHPQLSKAYNIPMLQMRCEDSVTSTIKEEAEETERLLPFYTHRDRNTFRFVCPCGKRIDRTAYQEVGIGGREAGWSVRPLNVKDPAYACRHCGRIFDRSEPWNVIDRVALGEQTEPLSESADTTPAVGDVFRVGVRGSFDARILWMSDEPAEATFIEDKMDHLADELPKGLCLPMIIYFANAKTFYYLVGAFKITEGIGGRSIIDTSVLYTDFSDRWHQTSREAEQDLESRYVDGFEWKLKMALRAPLRENVEIGTVMRDTGHCDDYVYTVLDTFDAKDGSQMMLLKVDSDRQRKTMYGLGLMRHEEGIGGRIVPSKNLTFMRSFTSDRKAAKSGFDWYARRLYSIDDSDSGVGGITTEVAIVESTDPKEYMVFNGTGTWCVCGTKALWTSRNEGIGGRTTWDVGRSPTDGSEYFIGCPKCGRIAKSYAHHEDHETRWSYYEVVDQTDPPERAAK